MQKKKKKPSPYIKMPTGVWTRVTCSVWQKQKTKGHHSPTRQAGDFRQAVIGCWIIQERQITSIPGVYVDRVPDVQWAACVGLSHYISLSRLSRLFFFPVSITWLLISLAICFLCGLLNQPAVVAYKLHVVLASVNSLAENCMISVFTDERLALQTCRYCLQPPSPTSNPLWERVNRCFEPSQPLRIISGLKGTFIKRCIVERTNNAGIRPEEQNEKKGEFMDWNTVERAIKTEIDARTE